MEKDKAIACQISLYNDYLKDAVLGFEPILETSQAQSVGTETGIFKLNEPAKIIWLCGPNGYGLHSIYTVHLSSEGVTESNRPV
jgi:hypothetical protein